MVSMGFSLREVHGATAVAAESVRVPRGVIVALKIRIAAPESKQKIVRKLIGARLVETEARISRP